MRVSSSARRLLRFATRLIVCALPCLVVLCLPRVAHAQRYYVVYRGDDGRGGFDLGFDAEGAAILSQPHLLGGETLSGGSGFKVRLGEQFRFRGLGLRLTPEVGYGYEHLWATDDLGDAYAWNTNRVFAGVRLGFGRVVVPTIYAHAGYGWRLTGDPLLANANGPAFDAGFALDIYPVRRFGIGGHIEYVTIDSQPGTPQWLALGLHADIIF
jgi:hypothetical protein